MQPVRHVSPQETPELFYMGREVTDDWASLTAYVVGDARLYNSRAYVCLEDHTSDTFATDFADGKWKQEKLFNSGTDEIPVWTIYDQIFDESAEVTGKAVRRRVKDGVQKVHLESDQMTYYYNDELVATAIIIPQYWQVNHWADFAQPLDDYIDVTEDGHLVGSGTQGGFSWDIDIGFQKWTVNLVAPGVTVRAVWEITFTSLGQQLLADGVLRFSTEDYTGNILDDEGIAVRTVIFEPDGSVDGMTIDPYLTINDQGSYIDVYCDGYIASIRLDNGSQDLLEVYETTNTNKYFDISPQLNISGGYYFSYATDEAIVLEDTSLRKVVRVIGGASSSSSDGNPLKDSGTNDLIAITTFYFYDDHVVIDISLQVVGGTITLDSANNDIIFMDYDTGVVTGNAVKYESSDTEVTGDGNYHDSADYFVGLSNEANVQVINLNYSVTGTAVAYQDSTGSEYVQFGLRNGNISTGETKHTTLLIIDTEEREGSAQIYNEAARVSLGNQWKDLVFPAITGGYGAAQSDWMIPLSLDATGSTADSTQRVEADGDSIIKTTADRDRVNHKYLVDAADCFRVGDPASPTDLLIEYFKFNDNAASSTVVATVGNNATWEDSSGNGSNTENSDVSTDITRDGGLDTADTYHVECSTTVYDNAFFKQGTIDIKFTPQFGYDDADDQTIWNLYIDANNQIQIVYDAGNDRYELRVVWGGTTATINGTAFTESTSLQQPTVLHASWDSDLDVLYFSRNGQDASTGTNTGTPSSSGAAYVCAGAQSDGDGTTSLNADIFLDELTVKDSCICQFGAFFTDEGNSYANPHENVTFHWAGSDTLAIGSGSITKSGDYLTDGPLGKKAFNPTASTGYATAVTSGNISFAEGELDFWVEGLNALTSDATFLFADTGFRIWWDDSDNDIVFSYGSTPDTVRTATAITDGGKHHVRVWWKASTEIGIEVDGYNRGVLSSGVDAATTPDTNMYFNADDASGTNLADVLTANWTIVSKMGTPQIWTVLGQGPILQWQTRVT